MAATRPTSVVSAAAAAPSTAARPARVAWHSASVFNPNKGVTRLYLVINNQNYPLRRRRLTDQSVTYYGMTEMPETVSGTITMYRDDGFEMSVDDADSYARQVKSGTVLVLTNEPEPPEPPEPQISDDEAVAIITDTLTTSEALNIITGGTT